MTGKLLWQDGFEAVTWNRVKSETKDDYHLSQVMVMVENGFPRDENDVTTNSTIFVM